MNIRVTDKDKEIINWIYKTFGTRSTSWSYIPEMFNNHLVKISIGDPELATMFMLRWADRIIK